MLVQLWNSMFHKSNVLIASHYHLIVGFVSLSLYILFSHDKTSTNRMDPVNYGFRGLEKSDS